MMMNLAKKAESGEGRRHTVRPSPKFNPDLESLRGITALAVLVTHSIAVFSVDGHKAFWAMAWKEHTAQTAALHLVSAVFNAGGAVVLFFVLSGYVLTLSLNSPSRLDLAGYAIKRLFRLLPPMWASIVLSASVVWAIPVGGDGYSAWFTAVFQSVSTLDIIRNFALIEFKANPVTWTMFVELIGSAIVIFATLAHRYRGTWASCGLLCVYAFALYAFYPSTTFSYLVCFQAGALLALTRLPNAGALGVLVVGFLIIVSERLLPISGPNSVAANTVGSSLVIYAVLNGKGRTILRTKSIRHIGTISYSLYLFHLPVIYLLGIWLPAYNCGKWTVLFLLFLAIPLSILLATIAYKLIEAPAMSAGRSLAENGVSNTERNPIR